MTVLALLLTGLSAISEGIPAGKWTTSPEEGQYRMMLGKDGAFIFTSDDITAANGIPSDTDTGTFTVGADTLTLMQNDGTSTTSTSFKYRLESNTLTLNEGTADSLTFTFKPYNLPAGLAAQWAGEDENGAFIFTFEEDSSFNAAYTDGTEIASGIYLSDSSSLLFAFNNGNYMEMAYQLSGDTLNLQDKRTGEEFNTKRLGEVKTRAAAFENKDLGISLDVDSSITINDTNNDEGIVYLYISGEHIPYVMVKRYEPADINQFISAYTAFMQEGYQDSDFTAGTPIRDKVGDRTVDAIFYTYSVQGNTINDTRVFFIENGWLYMFAKKENVTMNEYAGDLLEHAIINFKAIGPASPGTAVPLTQEAAIPPVQDAEASSLTGIWKGKDTVGTRLMTLTQDGTLTLAYEDAQSGAAPQQGIYLSDSSSLTVLYGDGTKVSYRYILMGDTLMLTDADLGSPITLERVKE